MPAADHFQTPSAQPSAMRLSTVATTTRQAAKTDFGSQFKQGLMAVGQRVANGASVAASVIPGGSILSAAVAGANDAVTGSQLSYRSGTGAPSSANISTGSSPYNAPGSYGFTSNAFGSSSQGLTGGTGSVMGTGTAALRPAGTIAVPGGSPGLNSSVSSGGFGTGAISNGFGPSTTTGTNNGTVPGASDGYNNMMNATRQMTELQASFNLQYLQLQEKTQQDNRQFSVLTNLMKVKHDAAKSAIGNLH